MTQSVNFQESLARSWRNRATVSRAEVFGVEDPLRPNSNLSDVDTAAPGMVGPNYQLGGIVLLSINPAGGKDDAVGSTADKKMYQTFRDLRVASPPESVNCFETLNNTFQDELPGWAIYGRHIAPILNALNASLTEIAYIYVIPFRTRGDKAALIRPGMVENAWNAGLAQQLSVLQPGTIVALDLSSNKIAERYAQSKMRNVKIWYYPRKRDAHAARKALLQSMGAVAVSIDSAESANPLVKLRH